MPPRRRQGAKPSPEGAFELPNAIWENIASQLSIKDWARASGTCRSTAKTQLQKIDVPSGTPEEVLLWVMKRLASVETLRLRADCAEQLVLATGPGSLALRRLQHLLIEAPEAASGIPSFEPMLAWLLSRAENLQLLSATFGDIFYFPPMPQLKHLALTYKSFPQNFDLFRLMSHAVSLETLLINSRVVINDPGLSLRLENLKSLQRLALRFVFPADLQVCGGCSVFLEGSAVSSMPDDDWSCKVVNNISHLRFVDKKSELLAFPESFAGFQNLQVVYLSLSRLGNEDACVSLQDGLANVKRLLIKADDIFITVPASVQWEEVWFGSEKALSITLMDVDAFVSSCSHFAICYKSLIGAWMPKMCQCLAAQGLEYEVKDRGNGKTLLTRGKVSFVKCFCGACLKCLAPSQEAVSDWVI